MTNFADAYELVKGAGSMFIVLNVPPSLDQFIGFKRSRLRGKCLVGQIVDMAYLRKKALYSVTGAQYREDLLTGDPQAYLSRAAKDAVGGSLGMWPGYFEYTGSANVPLAMRPSVRPFIYL
ncbi:hypothetical protein CONPUDRAFT_149523 [Coniophora puteana RWD-64-598 SS2]|uniref:Uncharacterized protein n=1 Tax=Coniophora puteana (strain RWD-64-598) TaxID=741705 RepID=A0A5M3MZQ6_CONPW|nr:uncharacterized protein CONPUDRAFT_149523 [Coniophora puteana RWD-64-598 SS2]EIW84643.1 hypothetical protein CONPUDRAFT_149523 [Coniophora puteana RWD-64-598 SS2]